MTTLSDVSQFDAHDLAQRIAAHITGPGRWSAQPDRTREGERGCATLTRLADGAEIGITIGGFRNEGRVTFRARWPKYGDGNPYSPPAYLSITCKADREPRVLAREIERRLLAEYDPAYRKACDEVRASNNAQGDAWRVAERIAVAVGAELPRTDSYRAPRNGAAVDLYGSPSHVRGLKVHPGYGDRATRVSFEVDDVDEETALRLLSVLADLPEAS